MNRITVKHLESLVDCLNKITASPMKPYIDGKPQAGNYHISRAYGGYCLHRMSLKHGCSGVTTPLSGGHIPAREVYNEMRAFINGIDSIKGN
jgi:hypothetical protein